MSDHFPPEVPESPRGPRWIAVAWLAVLAWRHVPVAYASHSHTGSNQLHLSTIHGNNGTATTHGRRSEAVGWARAGPALTRTPAGATA